MLILCVGPDTFRSHARARELEKAFQDKYDPTGSSIEHLSPGKLAVDEILQRADTASLFSPRRFLRTSDVLGEGLKNKLSQLAQALTRDPEHLIVVSVESEVPSAATLKLFEKVKIIKYEYPEQQGKAFLAWVKETARLLQVDLPDVIAKIAQATDGDSWLAWNELMKVSAGGVVDIEASAPTLNLFEWSERYLKRGADRLAFMLEPDIVSQILPPLLSQTRAALRVRDGATTGLHPYVVKKMTQLHFENLESSLAQILLTLFCQRSGLATDEQAACLL